MIAHVRPVNLVQPVARHCKQMSETEFLGYEGTEASSKIVSLFKTVQPVDSLAAGDEGAVILSATPFYAESGGQIGDTGILVSDGKLFHVADTQKSAKANVHFGTSSKASFRSVTSWRLWSMLIAARRFV